MDGHSNSDSANRQTGTQREADVFVKPASSRWVVYYHADMSASKVSTPGGVASAGAETSIIREQDSASRRRELAIVIAVTLAISLILWWRFLPLPDGDLNFYTEPAFLLATIGKLAGPGSQYIDLTYQKAMYFYPPGHFLILAGWIKLFGLSADSLLAYTHAVHAGILISLWALLRFRYACSKLISTLVLLSVFPAMPHGRPDLTACLLSLLAWLVLPEEEGWKRLAFSGLLAGATLLVSPAYGVGIIATLTVLILVRSQFPFRVRVRSVLVWLLSAGLFFWSVAGTALSLQHSWTLAYIQFKTNATIRGHMLNVFPDMRLLFTYVFSIVPFLVLAVIPAFLAVLFTWRHPRSKLRDVSVAFLGGTAVWFALNKSQLLLNYHFLFPSKSIFLGVLCSWPRFPTWLRVAPLLLLSAIHFYYQKGNFLYFATPLRETYRNYGATVQPVGEVAVDSLYFARFYRIGHSLNYETVVESFWPQYLAAIPAGLQNEMLSGLERKPVEPSMLVVSAATVRLTGEPHGDNLTCTRPPEAYAHLRTFGRTWNLPANPYALFVCSTAVR